MNKKPNIVLIVIDTHRRDRLGMYGYKRGISPNLDAFARSATVFDNAISPAQWTVPSHASIFTGEYVNTHLTTQPGHSLDRHFRTITELLADSGYQSTGFCNNPLVGVLDNELKRGFDTFYNYGGAIQTAPVHETHVLLKPLSKLWSRYTQLLRKISYPVQNLFAKSDRMFQLSLNPAVVPFWTKLANFKGDTAKSLEDADEFIRSQLVKDRSTPKFVFINIMETHLPFTPPTSFVKQFAPSYFEEREARDFMRVYNTQALRWLLPMEEPFSLVESEVLNGLYDAEVAYQDSLLSSILELLDSPYHRENTMVIIVSDHGEMLGEHNLMGHSFRVYQELVHVPFVIRFPGQSHGLRVKDVVSTLQLFHSILEAIHWKPNGGQTEEFESTQIRIDDLSLFRYLNDSNVSDQPIFSEAFPPLNVIKILNTKNPELMRSYNCTMTYRAAFNQKGYKYIHIEDGSNQLYHLDDDPLEKNPFQDVNNHKVAKSLQISIDNFLESTLIRRPETWLRKDVNIKDDKLAKRLRALGYLE